MKTTIGLMLLAAVLAAFTQFANRGAAEAPGHFDLRLQSRKAKGAALQLTSTPLDPKKCGVVIVDMWNYHWCMTAAERVGSMVPRMNLALAGARKLGMPIIWAPTDVADQYVGRPQRERVMALDVRPRPQLRALPWHGTIDGGCLCGPGLDCPTNYGWDGMHPGLTIADNDFIVGMDADEMYALCRKLGLTDLIYMGVHTNRCVLGKGPAIKNMYDAGLRCILARDLTDAMTYYKPEERFTPDDGTATVVADLEASDIPTINFADELRRAGLWQDDAVTEPVRITPWGSASSPYQFRDTVTATLSAPWLTGVHIRYTLDGSQPSAKSPRYEKPFAVDRSVTIRAAAFASERRMSVPSEAVFAKLGADPPLPDIWLEMLRPIAAPGGRPDNTWPLSRNQSLDGKPISIRGKTYEHGLVGRAPAAARYTIETSYDRFVAMVGVDDAPLRMRDYASFIGKHAAVRVKLFVDGEEAFATPPVRLGQAPYPVDVKLPRDAKQLHVVILPLDASDAAYAIGAVVNAGFMKRPD